MLRYYDITATDRHSLGLQDQFADRAVVLHAAGNSRAISAAIFESAVTAADVEAQINALV